jgi:hypothetical protein
MGVAGDGIYSSKSYAFLNSSTMESYWDVFSQQKEFINISDAPINPANMKKYWKSKNEVQVVTISSYLEEFSLVPYDKKEKRFLWSPRTYPRNSDGSYSNWTGTTSPVCANGDLYWSNSTDIKWISTQRYLL